MTFRRQHLVAGKTKGLVYCWCCCGGVHRQHRVDRDVWSIVLFVQIRILVVSRWAVFGCSDIGPASSFRRFGAQGMGYAIPEPLVFDCVLGFLPQDVRFCL